MKEKLTLIALLILVGLIGAIVGWLYLQLIGRSPLFKINNKVLAKRDWFARRIERIDGSFAVALRESIFNRPSHKVVIHTQQIRRCDVTKLIYRNDRSVYLEYYVHHGDHAFFRVCFNLRKDAGYRPYRDFSTEYALLDIIEHQVVERLKRIENL